MGYGAGRASEAPGNGLVDVSAAERRDEAATARDDAAVARDAAAALRDEAAADAEDARQSGNRVFAAADRAASARDRQDAALDRHSAEDTLQQAYRDDLTGLPLRTAGLDQLAGALDRARRIGEPIVVAFLDVDHLKSVNDEHGHGSGDDLLRAVGTALRRGLRSYDVVMRYGGDEFLCALVGARRPDAALRIDAVGTALAEASAGASFSFGLAELTDDTSLVDLIAQADGDMYARRAVQRA